MRRIYARKKGTKCYQAVEYFYTNTETKKYCVSCGGNLINALMYNDTKQLDIFIDEITQKYNDYDFKKGKLLK